MSMTRELFALEGRIKRLQKAIEPPTLRMVQVYDQTMSEASVNEFTLAFIIEDRQD